MPLQVFVWRERDRLPRRSPGNHSDTRIPLPYPEPSASRFPPAHQAPPTSKLAFYFSAPYSASIPTAATLGFLLHSLNGPPRIPQATIPQPNTTSTTNTSMKKPNCFAAMYGSLSAAQKLMMLPWWWGSPSTLPTTSERTVTGGSWQWLGGRHVSGMIVELGGAGAGGSGGKPQISWATGGMV